MRRLSSKLNSSHPVELSTQWQNRSRSAGAREVKCAVHAWGLKFVCTVSRILESCELETWMERDGRHSICHPLEVHKWINYLSPSGIAVLVIISCCTAVLVRVIHEMSEKVCCLLLRVETSSCWVVGGGTVGIHQNSKVQRGIGSSSVKKVSSHVHCRIDNCATELSTGRICRWSPFLFAARPGNWHCCAAWDDLMALSCSWHRKAGCQAGSWISTPANGSP